MHTETTTRDIYTFNELTEEGKQSAIDNWRNMGDDWAWGDENRQSLDTFESEWPVKVTGWEYSLCSHSYINYEMEYIDYDEVLEFTGIRLMKWIVNNYSDVLWSGHWVSGKYYPKERHSRITMDPYMPTGYCMDNDIRQPIYDFLKAPSNHTTIEDILYDC